MSTAKPVSIKQTADFIDVSSFFRKRHPCKVTGGVGDSPPVVSDVLGKQFLAFFKGTDCEWLVFAHQLAVAFDIRTEDGPEFALYAVVSHDGPRRDMALSQ